MAAGHCGSIHLTQLVRERILTRDQFVLTNRTTAVPSCGLQRGDRRRSRIRWIMRVSYWHTRPGTGETIGDHVLGRATESLVFQVEPPE